MTNSNWSKLEAFGEESNQIDILDLFSRDPSRVGDFKIESEGLYFDYSKTRITRDIRDALLGMLGDVQFDQLRAAMFSGAKINKSENRAVLHSALRKPKDQSLELDGTDISADIHSTLKRIEEIVTNIQSDSQITDVVHIGIGGSDLGPYMVVDALKEFHDARCRVHFVSNVDGAALHHTLKTLDPKRTVFLVASKSFTTEETLMNAKSARDWIVQGGGDVETQFYAMSANPQAASEFGLKEENVLPFGDYVGGRFSLWSSIGLPIALAVGFENFRALLDGAHAMDQHFMEAPALENIPVMLALVGVWHRTFCDYESLAILPYAQNLQYLPAYLQQMDMESNGKEMDQNGAPLSYATGPIVFGASGTNGQHAFYQLIHQSRTVIPCEFIAFKETLSPYKDHHETLLAHALAQPRALMVGRKETQGGGYFSGNRPSTMLLINRLDPYNLGQLLALYEHKIFVQGALWGLNSFDQPGVELGKILAKELKSIQNGQGSDDVLDPSTKTLLKQINAE